MDCASAARSDVRRGGDDIVEPAVDDRNALEISVIGGRVRQIQWHGKPVLKLIDVPLEQHFADRVATGEFGVINYFGSTTFHNITFTDTRSE